MKKSEQRNFYKKNGYLIIKNFYPKTLINDCKKNIEVADQFKFKRLLHKNDYAYEKNKLKYLKMPELMSPKIYELINNKLLDLVCNLIEDEVSVRGIELHQKIPGTDFTPPHQDNFYFCLKNLKALTAYVPLNRQDFKNGGLHVYPKSHKNNYEHFSSNTVGFSSGIKINDIIEKKLSYSLSVGDLSIHHCNIIHGAPENSSKSSRISIAIRFIAINEKIDKKKKERYISFLNKSKRYSGV